MSLCDAEGLWGGVGSGDRIGRFIGQLGKDGLEGESSLPSIPVGTNAGAFGLNVKSISFFVLGTVALLVVGAEFLLATKAIFLAFLWLVSL